MCDQEPERTNPGGYCHREAIYICGLFDDAQRARMHRKIRERCRCCTIYGHTDTPYTQIPSPRDARTHRRIQIHTQAHTHTHTHAYTLCDGHRHGRFISAVQQGLLSHQVPNSGALGHGAAHKYAQHVYTCVVGKPAGMLRDEHGSVDG